MYFININITNHACFTWIVVFEFNFTVTFLLTRKTWDDRFAGKVGGGGGLTLSDSYLHSFIHKLRKTL